MSLRDDAQERLEKLQTEIELIEASLLPAESLASSSPDTFPVHIDVTSADSSLRLYVTVAEAYPYQASIKVEVKGDDVGREDASAWAQKVDAMMVDWDDNLETPLYGIMTTHFLPLLSAPPGSPSPSKADDAPVVEPKPHHALITTHHLLSPTKKKLLIQLSADLNLVGFSKTGHPGILYAIGEKEDVEEWLGEVKSWNWLALKVRVTCEPVPEYPGDIARSQGEAESGRGKTKGKSRGDWVELDKLSDALEWMRKRGREQLLIDAGVGSNGSS